MSLKIPIHWGLPSPREREEGPPPSQKQGQSPTSHNRIESQTHVYLVPLEPSQRQLCLYCPVLKHRECPISFTPNTTHSNPTLNRSIKMKRDRQPFHMDILMTLSNIHSFLLKPNMQCKAQSDFE